VGGDRSGGEGTNEVTEFSIAAPPPFGSGFAGLGACCAALTQKGKPERDRRRNLERQAPALGLQLGFRHFVLFRHVRFRPQTAHQWRNPDSFYAQPFMPEKPVAQNKNDKPRKHHTFRHPMNTTQTILWMKRLAVMITAGGFCICAHAADINTSIAQAIYLSWPSTLNRAYQVEVSTNLTNWTPTGGLIEGTGGTLSRFFTLTNGQRFFRIQETSATPVFWLDGTWTGQAFAYNTPPAATEEAMVELVVDATNRVFRATYTFNTPPACTATFRLVSYSDTRAEFQESTVGCTTGPVVLTRLNATTIAFNFYYSDPAFPGTGAGLLTKQ